MKILVMSLTNLYTMLALIDFLVTVNSGKKKLWVYLHKSQVNGVYQHACHFELPCGGIQVKISTQHNYIDVVL